MYKPSILIHRVGGAIGDRLMATMFVRSLQNAGIEAYVNNPINSLRDLFCSDLLRTDNNSDNLVLNFNYENNRKELIFKSALNYIKKRLLKIGYTEEIINKVEKSNIFPIFNLTQENNISKKKYDVFLATKCGSWSNVRTYPYFNKLKDLLKSNNISFIDIWESNIKNKQFLETLFESKIFVGLETGTTHFAAQFLNKNNSLILQSGYYNFHWWAGKYDLDHIEVSLECSPCLLRNTKGCKYNHKCMTDIKPEIVFTKILEKLTNFG